MQKNTGKKIYAFLLDQGTWTVFPLSDGNGNYKVTVYQSVEDKYASVLSVSCAVNLTDEFAPFLRPNQYVNYARSSTAVLKAAELTAGVTDPLKKVEAVYDYVVATLTYDKAKAASVKSGYLPDVEGGIVPACEIMRVNSAIRSMIRDNKTHQINNAIAAGGGEGMISMDQHIQSLYQEGAITRETALEYADNQEQMRRNLNGTE